MLLYVYTDGLLTIITCKTLTNYIHGTMHTKTAILFPLQIL